MSFDVFMQFIEKSPPSDDETADARFDDVVRSFGGNFHRDPADAPYILALSDGSEIECWGRGPLTLRGITEEKVRFIFEVMRATGWVTIIPGGERACIASLRPIAHELLRDGAPDVTCISSQQDLAELLGGNFDKWSDFRDKVVKG